MAQPPLHDLRAQADALFRAGKRTEAIAAYTQVLANAPDDPDGWFNLGVLLRQSGQIEGALEAYQKALDYHVTAPEEVHLNRSVLYLEGLRDGPAAAGELEAALRLKPDFLPALINLASLREDEGARDAARELYDRALALAPDDIETLTRRAGLDTASTPDHPMITRLQAALRRPGLSAQDRAALGFSLGRLLDQCGAYDDAFAAFRAANTENAKAAPRPYDRRLDTQRVAATKAAFPAVSPTEQPDGAAPIFILGMFRSGSTLIEQVLASHPQVTSGGELDLIPRMAGFLGSTPDKIAAASQDQIDAMRHAYRERMASIGSNTQQVTDKRPDNFWHIGLIKRLFPDARIIHTRRQPLDNCLSVYFLHLNPQMTYAHDLVDCGHHLQGEREMMAHWKALWPNDILTVDYEDMIIDQRATTERLLDFLGLPWDEACLDFHRARSLVRTASVWQVREPIHDRSVGRWRNYATHIGDLSALFPGTDAD